MRKIICFGLGILLFITSLMMVKNVMAEGCVVIEAPGSNVCDPPEPDGSQYCTPFSWTTGDCGGIDNGGCPPNWHSVPAGGCRENGSGGSAGGGSEPSCNYGYIQNCPAGYTRGNQIISTTDVSVGQLRGCGNAVGSAQTLGSCSATVYDDAQGFDVCQSYYVYLYQCYPGCSSGSTLQCGLVPQDYTYTGGTTCPAGQTAQSGVSYGACYMTTNDKGHWVTICPTSMTCRRMVESCSCVSNCTQTAPTGLSIVAGTTPGTTAVATWTVGSGSTGQFFWVDEDQAEVVAGCPTVGDCEASMLLSSSSNAILVSGLTPLRTYYFRLANLGVPGCSSEVIGTYTTPASTGAISGTVYLDASNTCAETSTLDNVSVVLDGVTTDTSGPSGAFSFAGLNLNSSHTLSASLPAGYTCSTAPACSAYPCTVSGVVSPTSGKKFYLTQNKSAWWQTEGAGVYAGGAAGTTIGSTIPTSLDPLDKYLVIPGAIGSSGAVMHTSSTAPSLSAGEVNADGWQARTTYKGKRANYDFFKNEMGLTTTTDSLLNLSTKPASGPVFHYKNGDGTISSTWSVGATEKYVIFVNGDLNINADITVAPGGFAAFIVKGSINVASDVQNIQGLFVADQNFNTTSKGTTDVELTVAGSVVAWGDVSLARDLVANNSNSPAELFVYRPDLLVNMPDEMKSFVMQWSEVVPGTYDEQ